MADNDLELGFDLDLTDTTESDLEQGDNVPPGYYHAEVDDVDHGVSKEKGTKFIKLEYKILCGPKGAVNRHVFQEVYLTENTKKQQAMILMKLGVIDKSTLGKQAQGTWSD